MCRPMDEVIDNPMFDEAIAFFTSTGLKKDSKSDQIL
jgi:hypothetical protein